MMRLMLRVPTCLLVVALWLAPAVALAGDAALAEVLFDEGLALMDEGKAEEACAKFAASMAAEPSGGAALNLGRCNENQGKSATAWANYKRAATLFAATNEGERRAFAQDQVARLEPTLSTLVVEVPDVEGIEVTRNGEPVPAAAFGTPLPVDPGEQILEARAEGHAPAQVTVDVAPGGAAEKVTIPPLEPRAEAAVTEESGAELFVISGAVLAGVGGAAVIAGAVVGALVLSDASEARELCGGDNTCDGTTQPGSEGLALADGAKGKAVAADVLVIGGSVVALGGAVLLVIGLTRDDASPEMGWQLTPWVGPETAGMQLGGAF